MNEEHLIKTWWNNMSFDSKFCICNREFIWNKVISSKISKSTWKQIHHTKRSVIKDYYRFMLKCCGRAC